MDRRLPLSALLSQALVAFTIEFDNESERQLQHRTTRHGSTGTARAAPWLTSLVMWTNCLQFVGEQGVTVRELRRLARTGTNLDGMRRWGYITIDPAPAGRSKQPRRDAVIRPTPAGRRAQEIWRPTLGVIENRWLERFGEDEITALRDSLLAVASRLDPRLPDCLPILGYGLFSSERMRGGGPRPDALADHEREEQSGVGDRVDPARSLPALLSRVLLGFAIDFERQSELSLAISANLLRVLDDRGVYVRTLPQLTGVSKEAIAMAMGILEKHRIAVIEADPTGGRFKVARLTPKGRETQDASGQLLTAIEERWETDYGRDTLRTLRESLERIVGDPADAQSPLRRALEPHPGGWRAAVRKPDTLPHYPMMLHRGGFPDGS